MTPRMEGINGEYVVIYQDGKMVVEEQNEQVACHLPPSQGDLAERCCSFCGMSAEGNRRLIGGQTAGVYICDECVSVCRAVLDDERADDPAGGRLDAPRPDPPIQPPRRETMAVEEVPVPAHLDTGQITEDRIALERSTREVADRYDELLEEYPNQWIALQHSPPDESTIVSGESISALSKAIEEHSLNRNHLAVHFMDKQRRAWILARQC